MGGAVKRGGNLARKTPLSRARLRTAGTLDPARSLEYAKAREAVLERSGGRCDVCSAPLSLPDMHCHHRLARSAGREDRPSNLLALDAHCHLDVVHGNPALARDNGWIISRHDHRGPGEVPVQLHGGDWFLLTDDGARIALAEPPSRP